MPAVANFCIVWRNTRVVVGHHVTPNGRARAALSEEESSRFAVFVVDAAAKPAAVLPVWWL